MVAHAEAHLDHHHEHPPEPHYYLEFLGTRRGQQSRGGGTAVLQPMLDRCDAEGVPAYLESLAIRLQFGQGPVMASGEQLR